LVLHQERAMKAIEARLAVFAALLALAGPAIAEWRSL